MRIISTRQDVQVNIRMPLELKALLRQESRQQGRSFNAEVLKRLVESVENLMQEGEENEETQLA